MDADFTLLLTGDRACLQNGRSRARLGKVKGVADRPTAQADNGIVVKAHASPDVFLFWATTTLQYRKTRRSADLNHRQQASLTCELSTPLEPTIRGRSVSIWEEDDRSYRTDSPHTQRVSIETRRKDGRCQPTERLRIISVPARVTQKDNRRTSPRQKRRLWNTVCCESLEPYLSLDQPREPERCRGLVNHGTAASVRRLWFDSLLEAARDTCID